MMTVPLAARPIHRGRMPGRICTIGMPWANPPACTRPAAVSTVKKPRKPTVVSHQWVQASLLGVERHAEDPRHHVVHHAPQREGDEAEQREVRVRDRPVGEVDELVEAAQRLERSLDADRDVEGGAGQGEAQRNRGVGHAPRAAHRHEHVHDEGAHRDEQADRADDRDGLEPLRNRRAQDVVRADGGVEERDAPEGDERQRVAVDRLLGLAWAR